MFGIATSPTMAWMRTNPPATGLNIAFVAPFAFSPKATVSARMLPMAAALSRRGHRVTILIPPYDNPADNGVRWSANGVSLVNMRLPRSPIPNLQSLFSPLQTLSLALQLARHTRSLKPDIVHIFKPVGPGALALWMLAKVEGGRRKAEGNDVTSSFLLDPSYFVDNDDWEGRGGWLDVNPYPALQKRVMAWQERWCLKHASAVTCASAVLRERTWKLTTDDRRPTTDSEAARRILVLPNGPEESLRAQVAEAEGRRDALREQYGWAGSRVLIYAGTVPLNHDLDIAIKALQHVLAEPGGHGGLKWAIIATGDGLPSLKASIQQAGIEPFVEHHDFMPHDQLVQRLVAADIAVYPYRDTAINRAKCSGKVIDYMACGKPMIVSDVGMNREYIEHGRSGLLAPSWGCGRVRRGVGAAVER